MNLRIAAALAALAALTVACSGGSSTPAPTVRTTPPGQGYAGAFNASVAFTIDVPSQSASNAMARRAAAERRVQAAATAAPSAPPSGPPYVSPLVASIQITDVGVNGSSPAIAQPPKVVAGCANPGAGCTLSASVAAAPGAVNRYLVQTYAAPAAGGTGLGTLISFGYVDVTVPASGASSAAVGGALVSIGGYVAAIKFSPASATLPAGTAANLSVIVEAIDAAGAVIIGNNYYANPIVVSSSDTQNFTLNGQTTLSLAGAPDQQIAVQYSGAASLGTVLLANSTDSNGNPVSAKLEISIANSAPSSPTPMPGPAGPLSIYAIDANNSNILEYDVVNRVYAKQPVPSPTPRRAIQFNQAALPGSVSCSSSLLDGGPDVVGGLIVDQGGRILTQSSCTDGTSTFVYQFSASATGAPTPATFASEPNAGFVFYAMSAAAGTGTYYFSIYGEQDGFYPYGFSPSGAFQSEYFSNACASELGQPAACTGPPGVYIGQQGAMAADTANNLYVGQSYGDNIFSTATPPTPITPPGPGSATTIVQPPTVSEYSAATGVLPAVLPNVDIAGVMSELGAGELPGSPASIAIDGSTLYVLASGGAGNLNFLTPPSQEDYPGLSGCPAPSANAPLDGSSIACADGQTHSYLVAFDISTLLAVANFGLDVELTPKFVIGGDQVGRFGENAPVQLQASAQELAVVDGIVAVANVQPTAQNYSSGEIDVYDTRGVTGSHTDIAPVLVIPNIPASGSFPGTLFQTVAIGPTGSGTGGLSILARRNTHLNRIRLMHPARLR